MPVTTVATACRPEFPREATSGLPFGARLEDRRVLPPICAAQAGDGREEVIARAAAAGNRLRLCHGHRQWRCCPLSRSLQLQLLQLPLLPLLLPPLLLPFENGDADGEAAPVTAAAGCC